MRVRLLLSTEILSDIDCILSLVRSFDTQPHAQSRSSIHQQQKKEALLFFHLANVRLLVATEASFPSTISTQKAIEPMKTNKRVLRLAELRASERRPMFTSF